MARFKFACHLIQFGKEPSEDLEKVLREVAEAGWEAVESVNVGSAEELVAKATLARRYGIHLVNVNGPDAWNTMSISYNITLGNREANVPWLRRSDWGGDHPTDEDFQRAARYLEKPLRFCVEHGVKGIHHSHLNTLIETVEDAERMLAAAPDLWLLFDTGHLLAARSDPMQVFRSERLRWRIGLVHLKDFHADDPSTWNHRTQRFNERARFAELGQGNVGLDVRAVLQALEEIDYDGWVSLELDRPYPPRPPAEAARVQREYLRRLGY
ncbi:MAG: sugar phosphate isomerase/epimerase [Chloroflexi bacterium]|nr:sugar phosphate isomerase/epimerase [Chloroflexota bacterium]